MSKALTISAAAAADAAVIASLRSAVAERLTREHGRGHWSSCVTEKAVLRDIKNRRVLIARHCSAIVATLSLATRKPWAIDISYFTPVTKALYLHSMAVAPDVQRRGLGRQLLAQARKVARDSLSDAIRLDAYDGPAGAGSFYAVAGFREVGRVVYRRTPLVYFELLL